MAGGDDTSPDEVQEVVAGSSGGGVEAWLTVGLVCDGLTSGEVVVPHLSNTRKVGQPPFFVDTTAKVKSVPSRLSDAVRQLEHTARFS